MVEDGRLATPTVVNGCFMERGGKQGKGMGHGNCAGGKGKTGDGDTPDLASHAIAQAAKRYRSDL